MAVPRTSMMSQMQMFLRHCCPVLHVAAVVQVSMGRQRWKAQLSGCVQSALVVHGVPTPVIGGKGGGAGTDAGRHTPTRQ